MNKQVLIEEIYLGRELSNFSLASLIEGMFGNDAFSEVYFKTESGNMYLIHEQTTKFGQKGPWELRTARDPSEVYVFSSQEIRNGNLVLAVGQSFFYGRTGVTTGITQIVCVNTRRRYFPGAIGGGSLNIRSEFAKKAMGIYP